MSDRFARARAMAKQGFPEDAVDELGRALREAGLELELDLDDRGRVLLERDYDPVFVERLRALPGTVRDHELDRWRVQPERLVALIELLARLAGPRCSSSGCALLEGLAPSREHLDAHQTWCL